MSTQAELLAKQAAAAKERQNVSITGAGNVRLQSLTIQEQGASPIKIVLKGGCMPVIGAQFPVENRGGVYTPLYARQGYSSVTGLLFGDTEMTFAWDVPFFFPDDHIVTGTDVPNTPEELFSVIQKIQERGRACQVQIGRFSRIGVLRTATPTPGRGYLVDPSSLTNQLISPGTNLEVTLKWEWSGEGLPAAPSDAVASVEDVRGALASAMSNLSSALSDEDPFAPNFLDGLKSLVGKLNKSVQSVRSALSKITAFASAPAALANQALAACRLAGGLAQDLDRALGDIASDYQSVNDSASALFGSKRAKGQAKQSLTSIFGALNDAIKAIERSRKPRIVGVHPGQLLSVIAAKELGDADRWQEIADLNFITGKTVPAGTFSVEVKG